MAGGIAGNHRGVAGVLQEREGVGVSLFAFLETGEVCTDIFLNLITGALSRISH